MLRPVRILVLIALLMAGCGGTGAIPNPSDSTPSSAGPSPIASPGQFGRIEHATGATDLLLRFEQGGGFVAPTFLATQAPIFSLYGDGTVLFRNPEADPLPLVGSVSPDRPFRMAKLNEDQIQA